MLLSSDKQVLFFVVTFPADSFDLKPLEGLLYFNTILNTDNS